MKTPHYVATALALLLAAGCSSAPARPPYSAFESIPVPKGLEYQPADSTIIETPGVKAGRMVYRGRVQPESLAAALRSDLEANGWKLVGTSSSSSGASQVYDKGGTSLQVRIWEGGAFGWYTYVEMAAVEMGAKGVSSNPWPVPSIAPMPSASVAPSVAPMPSAAVPVTPAPIVTR